MPANSGDLALACTTLLADELVRGGVTDVVISPGARSTPLVLAASRNASLRTHVVLDERSASFFALGLAKTTLRPVALICTSGTAAANYHPAVIEARYSATPLLVLTADRPPEARSTGANQTIDQVHLYGTAPLWFFELPVPADEPDTARVWRSVSSRAAAIASGPPAGPVHLNLPFREPLVPSGSSVGINDIGGGIAGRPGRAPWERISAGLALPDPAEIEALAALLGAEPRGIVMAGGIAGTHAPGAIADLAERLGWPLLAEPQSNLRGAGSLPAGQLLAPSIDLAIVLAVGDPPTSRASRALLERAAQVVTVSPFGYSNPDRRSSWTLRADPAALAAAVAPAVPVRGERAWLDRWTAAGARVREAVHELIDEWEDPFEGRVARDVAAAAEPGSVLVAGSSMPIRSLDQFMETFAGSRVIANRGASGIDGFVSTAFGVAEAAGSAVALMGDLTFLHDAGSLAWLVQQRAVSGALTLVVVDNGGGGIFDVLPQSALPEHEAMFVTPHTADIGAIARASGCDYVSVPRMSALPAALNHSGCRVVHVLCDRGANAKRRAMISEVVERVLSTAR